MLMFPRLVIAKIESVVAGQAPVTLEWKDTSEGENAMFIPCDRLFLFGLQPKHVECRLFPFGLQAPARTLSSCSNCNRNVLNVVCSGMFLFER